jgi:tetratricopeptide (TPR) repeat protein
MKFIPLLLSIFCLYIYAEAQGDLHLAKRFFSDKEYNSAVDLFRKALDSKPTQQEAIDARFGLAQSLKHLDQLDAAVKEFELLLQSNLDPSVRLSILQDVASIFEEQYRPIESAQWYLQIAILGAQEVHLQALLKAIHLFWEGGEWELSKHWIYEFEKKYPSRSQSSKIKLILARIFAMEGNIELAEKSYLDAIKADRKSELLYELSGFYEKNGKRDRAIESIREALILQPKSPENWWINYAQWTNQNDLKAYLNIWEKSNTTDIRAERPWSIYVEALILDGQADRALDVIKNKRELIVSVYQWDLLEAKALISRKERFLASEKLLKLGQGGMQEAYFLRAEIFLEDAMFLEAIHTYYLAYEKADRNDKRNILIKIAGIYADQLRRYAQAARIYEDILQNNSNHPENPIVLESLGKCYENIERWQEASETYSRILDEYPLFNGYDRIERHKKHLDSHKVINQNRLTKALMELLSISDHEKRNLELISVMIHDAKEYKLAYSQLRELNQKSHDLKIKAEAAYLSGIVLEKQAEVFDYQSQTDKASELRRIAIENYTWVLENDPDFEKMVPTKFRILELENGDLKSSLELLTLEGLADSLVYPLWFRIANLYQNEPQAIDSALYFYEKIKGPNVPINWFEKAGLERAKIYLDSNQLANSIDILNSISEKSQSDSILAVSHLMTAEIYEKLGNDSLALKYYQDLRYRFGSSRWAPEALLKQAELMIRMKKMEEGMNLFGQFVHRFPSNSNAIRVILKLAELRWEHNQRSEAFALLKNWEDHQFEHKDYGLLLAKIAQYYQLNEDNNNAALYYKRAIERSADQGGGWLLPLAEIYLIQEKYADAEPIFLKAFHFENRPTIKANALSGYLAVLAMQGKWEAYRKQYALFKKEYEKEYDAHARVIYFDARKQMESGEERKALRRFDYLRDRFSESSWAQEGKYYLGNYSFSQKKYQEAIQYLEEYLKNSHLGYSHAEASYRLAMSYFQLGHFDKSSQLFSELAVGKRGARLLQFRSRQYAALAYEKLELWTLATKMYEAILHEDREYLTSLSILVSGGFTAYRAGDFENAILWLKEIVESNHQKERKAEAHFWYAKVLQARGDTEAALSEFLKVNYLYPTEEMWGLTALFEVGQVYESQNDPLRAIHMYEQIVRRDGTKGVLGKRAQQHIDRIKSQAIH